MLTLAAVLLLAGRSAAHAGPGSLTQGPLVGRAYKAILDAQFDQIDTELAQLCGPAPAEACGVLRAAALWWQIQQDWHDTSRDSRLLQLANDAISATEAWTHREPRRAETWFYLGAAYGVRLQWRGQRGEVLAAARDGKRVKDALERAVALDPGLNDAYFGIGLYHYYADVTPTILKVLRWLLLLPGGDRTRGLSEMLRTRDGGEVLGGEADFQLHLIYLWYEKRPDRALELLDGLRQRYPHNPVFVRAAAEACDLYLHDPAASYEAWADLAVRAERGDVYRPDLASVEARLGIARQLALLDEADRAVTLMTAVVAARPSAPYGALARANLELGRAHDQLGQREAAVAAYRAALTEVPGDDRTGVRAQASAGLASAPDARAGEARRLSVEGLRALQRGDADQADALLGRALVLAPGDPVTLLRRGRVHLARGDTAAALSSFEQVLAARAPGVTRAGACLEAGRLAASRGDRARAIDLLQRAAGTRGADRATREAAAAAIAKLQLQKQP